MHNRMEKQCVLSFPRLHAPAKQSLIDHRGNTKKRKSKQKIFDAHTPEGLTCAFHISQRYKKHGRGQYQSCQTHNDLLFARGVGKKKEKKPHEKKKNGRKKKRSHR
jgi:hypothetical protein